MTLAALEVAVLILILASFIKILYLIFNKKAWWGFVDKFYRKSVLSTIILLVLAAVVFGYLLLEITIVQVMAALALASLIFAIAFLQYPKEMGEFAQKVYRKRFSVVQVIFVIVWIFICLSALVIIFS